MFKNLTQRMGKWREVIKKYGKTGVIVYLGISTMDLSLLYLYLSWASPNQVKRIQDFVYDTMKIKKREEVSKVTTFVIAYSIHKLLVPIRLPLTAIMTPRAAKILWKYGILKK